MCNGARIGVKIHPSRRFLMRLFLMVGVLVAGLPCGAAAQGLVTQKALSVEMAQMIVQGTIERCRADGFRASVSVIDAGGHLKAFARDEGTGLHTIDLSQRKAYTALTFATRFASSLEFATARGSTLGSACIERGRHRRHRGRSPYQGGRCCHRGRRRQRRRRRRQGRDLRQGRHRKNRAPSEVAQGF